jgi:hypothetical protein
MISILFHVTIKAGKEKEFHELAVRLTKETRAEDDGCLTYAHLQQQDSPNEYVLNEQWRDQDKKPSMPIWHISKPCSVPPLPGKDCPGPSLTSVKEPDPCSMTWSPDAHRETEDPATTRARTPVPPTRTATTAVLRAFRPSRSKQRSSRGCGISCARPRSSVARTWATARVELDIPERQVGQVVTDFAP